MTTAQTGTPLPAIYFEALDYTARKGVMGRQVAGEAFLTALFRYARSSEFHVHAGNQASAVEFARRAGLARAGCTVQWIPATALGGLAKSGALMFPSPALGQFAWRREPLGRTAFSIVGITHSIATPAMIEQLHALLVAPLAPWDALVCTSNAVRAVVMATLEPMMAFLERPCTLELPVIPLGIDAPAFKRKSSDRRRWREKMAIPEDAIAILSIGRMSFHAKAHPIPMYLAIERAARRSRHPLHLIEAGWFAQPDLPAAYAQARASYMPSVVAHVLDGQDPDVRAEIRSAADIFVSLPDNIQETFGITPLEAMAAGLPCVASDWNGYRETVRDGKDGFLVPTVGPPPGLGIDLADRLAAGIDNTDEFLGRVSQSIVIDIAAAASAIARLANDEQLRRSCGEHGQARVRDVYDWSRIVPIYEDLWSELGARRRSASNSPPRPNLSIPDPFAIYSGYPTNLLGTGWRVKALAGAPDLEGLFSSPFTLTGQDLVLPRDQLDAMLANVRRLGESEVGHVLQDLAEGNRPLAARTLLWLAKWGCVALTPPMET